jgi:methyl-accepting chemotaxis protein
MLETQNMIDSVEQLHQAVVAEAAGWQKLGQRIGLLRERRNRLLSQCEDLCQQAKLTADGLKQQTMATTHSLATSVQGFRSNLSQLAGLPDWLPQAAMEAETAIQESFNGLTTVGEITLDAMDQEMKQMANEIADTIENEVQSTADFIEDDFTGALSEIYSTNVDAVCETYQTLWTETGENMEQLTEHTLQQVHELGDQLGEFRDGWKRSVTELKDAFEDVAGSINGLGLEVTELTNTVDMAMQTTGTGMNLATSSLNDITSVMEDIV